MSWSLQLRNGDLFHDKGHLATVQGPNKIAQDLRLWILTRLGEDEAHPWYGSTIDGGVEEGAEIGSVLDLSDPTLAATLIEAEIRRWATSYKEQQADRIESDMATYGNVTLRKDEILDDVTSINFDMVADTMFVNVTIKPNEAAPISLFLPVSTDA
jgi:hypothetical protein